MNMRPDFSQQELYCVHVWRVCEMSGEEGCPGVVACVWQPGRWISPIRRNHSYACAASSIQMRPVYFAGYCSQREIRPSAILILLEAFGLDFRVAKSL